MFAAGALAGSVVALVADVVLHVLLGCRPA